MDDLPRQIDTRPPLECGKCGHTDQIEIKDDEIHCYFCGNFAIIGMKSRWPFRNIGLSKVVNQGNHVGKSPVEGTKKEEPMGTYGKKCEAPGCEKRSWLKGLCHKHYIEKHGEYIPQNPFKGPRPKKDKLGPVPATPPPVVSRAVLVPENGQCSPMIPVIQVFLDADLLDRLVKAAKKDFRNPEQQAAYLIHKGLTE